MNVVRMAEFKNRELVAVLKELTQLAEDGYADGVAFAVKIGRAHRTGLAGDYQRNPDSALRAVERLKERLLQEQEEESGT